VQAPPLSEFVTPVLDHQRFFTRAPVEELLANARKQRGRQWRDWCNSDLVHQAKNPDGPRPLGPPPRSRTPEKFCVSQITRAKNFEVVGEQKGGLQKREGAPSKLGLNVRKNSLEPMKWYALQLSEAFLTN
jgi:hypothetical protein